MSFEGSKFFVKTGILVGICFYVCFWLLCLWQGLCRCVPRLPLGAQNNLPGLGITAIILSQGTGVFTPKRRCGAKNLGRTGSNWWCGRVWTTSPIATSSLRWRYTYQRSWPQEDGSLGDVATGPQPEHRILEGFQGWHPLVGRVTLNHRARLEQRFLGVAIEGKGVQDWQYAERVRYRIWPKFPVQAGKFSGYIAPHDEVLLQFGPHHGNRVLNQNRAGILGGWNITKLVQLEIGYLYQYTPRPNGIVDVNNHLLQVNLNSMVPLKQLLGRKTVE